jgi:glutamate racemase
MKNSPIGIFDSGIGGLTVANAIKNILPNENIIYFGDTEHHPYGEKSKKAIQNYSQKIISFLSDKNCKIIIIACNSASSFTRENNIKTPTGTLLVNVIDPVILQVSRICNEKHIGVIGTKATISSGIYQKKINAICKSIKISSLETPLLAPMIEEGFINEDISKTIIANYLTNDKLANIDHLILACTHYPLINKEIKDYYNDNVNIIDSPNIIANYVAKKLKEHNILNNKKCTKHYFYVSNYTKSFEKSTKFFFKETVKLKEVNLFV